jgi:CheY-specific phosphatase CheX
MTRVLLVKPTEAVVLALAAVEARFLSVTAQRLVTTVAKTGREASTLAASEPFDLIVLDAGLEKPDINALVSACASGFTRKKLWLAVSPAAQKLLPPRVPAQLVRVATGGWTESFLYACLAQTVGKDKAPPVDMHVMRSIIVGVVKVITRHTKIALVPGKVDSNAAAKPRGEVSALATFFGDDVVGAIIINAPRAMLFAMAQRLFPDRSESLEEPLYQDFCAEIMNQVLGVVRVELAEQGFALFPGLNLAASGATHALNPRLPGKYFRFPFHFQSLQFAVTLFCAYRTPFPAAKTPAPPASKWLFDVRLVNELRDSVLAVVAKASGQPVVAGLLRPLAKPPEARLVALVNGAGKQGSFLIALDVGAAAASAVQAWTAGAGAPPPPAGEGAEAALAHVVASSLHAIGAQFRKRALAYGYEFHEVFQGDFAADGALTYSLKGGGFYAELPLRVGAVEVRVVLGLDSRFAAAVFDAWPLVAAG